MGMDLQPIRPTKSAPCASTSRYPSYHLASGKREVIWGRYNWTGWGDLVNLLDEWGVDTSEFRGCNDGDRISAATCRAVADAIEAHLDALDQERREWLRPHIVLWRTCGGYRQL